jgi:diguanylate cyclase (GGDEF)-like protein
MQENFSTYKITLLLYLGVLLIPFGFWYTYNNVSQSSEDIGIVRQLGETGTKMMAFASNPEHTKASSQKIDTALAKIHTWVQANNSSKFYVGGSTLEADFNRIQTCWQQLKAAPEKQNTLSCLKSINSLSFTIDKMHTLKQNEIKNMFYISIIGTLMLMLLLIYFIRAYIQHQLKKHAIYDSDTHLFNRKYFLAKLHTAIERAKREKRPLSILFLSVENLADGVYSEKEKRYLAQKIGHILSTVTRESDTVCRYDTVHFAILMTQTDKIQVQPLEIRIREALKSHQFQLAPEPHFGCKISEFDVEGEETEEAFIKRSEN